MEWCDGMNDQSNCLLIISIDPDESIHANPLVIHLILIHKLMPRPQLAILPIESFVIHQLIEDHHTTRWRQSIFHTIQNELRSTVQITIDV